MKFNLNFIFGYVPTFSIYTCVDCGKLKIEKGDINICKPCWNKQDGVSFIN